jgi:hypothetical protein
MELATGIFEEQAKPAVDCLQRVIQCLAGGRHLAVLLQLHRAAGQEECGSWLPTLGRAQ